jgi:methylenetetrahydrofolate--tRNA-(uracil-5-)-methyltransferase
MKRLTVIGAGLAGSEAAWQAAERGISVTLYEMRPTVNTAAHQSDQCAELVCSNSMGSNLSGSAPHLLKEELRRLGSLVMRSADRHSVPAGGALAVDRDLYGKEITQALENHPNIEFRREELKSIPADRPLIIATGPLTSPDLSEEIAKIIGSEHLYFYDALSPIIDADTIDYSKAFFASRYGKGTDDYLNCPMNREEYREFVDEINGAKKVVFKSFEKAAYFEGCVPIEELARRGEKTLAFGPLKPVGLNHPETGEKYAAVLQLRKENKEGTAYNLVGCQTKMTYPEQKRVFRMAPGLENAEFFRYGAIHRNTYINAPDSLNRDLSLKTDPGLYFAGQIVGVEGYVESCAMGMMAGIGIARKLLDQPFELPPAQTAIGALLSYVSENRKANYQPMNINFGLFLQEGPRERDKKLRNAKIVQAALDKHDQWMKEFIN